MLVSRRFVFLFAGLLCGQISGQAESAEKAELYFGVAQGNFLIGDFRGAERVVEEILRLRPDYLPAVVLRARIDLERNELEAALSGVDQALKREPENLDYQNLRALALARLDRTPEAVELLESIREEADSTADEYRAASRLLGLLQMAEGQWDSAAATFEEVYNGTPETAASLKLASEAYLEKAIRAMEQDDESRALASLSQAIEVYGQETGQEAFEQIRELRLLRSRALAQRGDFGAAIRDLQWILGQESENIEVRITLASLFAAAERWESLQGLIDPLSNYPELADIHSYFAGRLALAKGRVGTARSSFEFALDRLESGPSRLRPFLHFYRAVCLQRLDRLEEAGIALEEALESGFRPDTVGEAVLAAQLVFTLGEPERAVPLLEAITLSQPDVSAKAWAMLGRAHRSIGDNSLALSAFNEALRLDPTDASTLALRGSLLRGIGDLQGALGDYQAASRMDILSPALRYELGLTYLQLGQLEMAELPLREAARKLPKHQTVDLVHANCAYIIGEYAEAIQSLDEYFHPELPEDQLEQHRKTLSSNAIYLRYALLLQDDPAAAKDFLLGRADSAEILLFRRYCTGGATRKEVLDYAGQAVTPEVAKAQISEVAFWMAEHERLVGSSAAAKELLQIASDAGHSDLVPYQMAVWRSRSR